MDTSRKIAVTGSTGMIGSRLVAELVRAGYTDIVLPVRNKGRADNIRKTFERTGLRWNGDGGDGEGAISIVETDLTDSARLAGILRGVHTVFDCAAAIMTGDLSERQLVENNVSIAHGVAGASVEAGVRRVIHISSIVVLAPGENTELPITEENGECGDTAVSAYARSKFLAGREIRRVEKAGIGLTLLYPAVVLGEGDWSANGSSALVPVIASGQPFYTGGAMAYADVCDVARACVAVAACPGSAGQGFIVAGENLSYRELLALGAKAAGKRPPFIKAGTLPVYAVYAAVRLASALGLAKDRSITRRNLRSVLYGNRYSGEKLLRECGFRYTPIEETVERIVKAYLNDRREKKKNGDL